MIKNKCSLNRHLIVAKKFRRFSRSHLNLHFEMKVPYKYNYILSEIFSQSTGALRNKLQVKKLVTFIEFDGHDQVSLTLYRIFSYEDRPPPLLHFPKQ